MVTNGVQDRTEARRHGAPGRTVFVIHGGPGAPGSAAGLARGLADSFHVIEPLQRWSSDVPLSVDRHVADLGDVGSRYAPGEALALVGESWGAMLALAFAARFPERVRSLALVGCGTFDWSARAALLRTLADRTTSELRERLEALAREIPDEGERFAAEHRLSDSLYTYCRAVGAEEESEGFDMKGHLESWNDMLRLQASGVYPAAFEAIRCPVVMLHGNYDPHPGPLVRASLQERMPQLEYREFERCGHQPWVEQHARNDFLESLRAWLAQNGPPAKEGTVPVEQETP